MLLSNKLVKTGTYFNDIQISSINQAKAASDVGFAIQPLF
jgi:hypothetical protein